MEIWKGPRRIGRCCLKKDGMLELKSRGLYRRKVIRKVRCGRCFSSPAAVTYATKGTCEELRCFVVFARSFLLRCGSNTRSARWLLAVRGFELKGQVGGWSGSTMQANACTTVGSWWLACKRRVGWLAGWVVGRLNGWTVHGRAA